VSGRGLSRGLRGPFCLFDQRVLLRWRVDLQAAVVAAVDLPEVGEHAFGVFVEVHEALRLEIEAAAFAFLERAERA